MKSLHKSGKTSPMTQITIVALAAFLLFGLIFSGKLGGTASTANPATAAVVTSPSGALVACPTAPTMAVVGTDALVASTTATPTTINYIVNGVYKGTSAPAVIQGNAWTVVADLSGYLAAPFSTNVGCGANEIATKLYAYANATVTVKDDTVTSSNTLTNGGGANNATAAAAGGVRNFPVIFQGTSQKSTGKLLWVVETPASTSANVSSISASINGVVLSPVAIPNGIAAANAASVRTAFEVPAILGAASVNGNLQIQNAASKQVFGVVKQTFYAEQFFVDADGKVQEGAYDTSVNGNNAAKYQDSFTYDISIR